MHRLTLMRTHAGHRRQTDASARACIQGAASCTSQHAPCVCSRWRPGGQQGAAATAFAVCQHVALQPRSCLPTGGPPVRRPRVVTSGGRRCSAAQAAALKAGLRTMSTGYGVRATHVHVALILAALQTDRVTYHRVCAPGACPAARSAAATPSARRRSARRVRLRTAAGAASDAHSSACSVLVRLRALNWYSSTSDLYSWVKACGVLAKCLSSVWPCPGAACSCCSQPAVTCLRLVPV